jgi:regulator of replication initiation timing
MAKQAVAAGTGLEPIDRLEEKVKLLVSIVTELRNEQGRMADENARLVRELDNLRARLASSEMAGSELSTLRDERDLIRSRVVDMLKQLESI